MIEARFQTPHRHDGFTVIELIFVIVLIGILLSVAIVSVFNAQNRSKRDSAVATAQQVKIKLSSCFQNQNRYPATQTEVVTACLNTVNGASLGSQFANTATYSYSATRADGTACTTTGIAICEKYTITVKKNWWNGSASDSDVLITP